MQKCSTNKRQEKLICFPENARKIEEIKDEPEKSLSIPDAEPVKNDETEFDALLLSAVEAGTAAEIPIVENAPQSADADDIVMLSDDERDENGKLNS